ncbi:MBL fold metallo-hydrolase [Telmatospirillum sp. J64-1]|uniref:MBL fold metallo-hydrolase n=1 Tax=Telmatospirillum sp. J64-1 TaxID=2502183 RepID=UPI00115D9AFD|nr:MBL fold metallo-hydrolase [Telmatospirillum sp. J64-1]
MKLRSFLASTAVVLALVGTAPAFAETVSSAAIAGYVQVADHYTFPLGDMKIVALSDGTVPQDLHQLLTGASPEEVDGLLARSFQSNPVEASINAYLIEEGDRRILVDVGSGQLFGPGNGGKLFDSLAAIGVSPGDITDILLTHIHTDHTGGLVLDGKAAFPNAIVHVSAPELSFFLDASNSEKTGYARQYFDEAEQTVGVYERAGKVKTFQDNETILPGILATIHPGHTPGSAFFTVTSKGETIVFVGDILHVASVQLPQPSVTILYDVDPDAAEATRKAALADLARTRQLIAAPHLPFPGVGYVRSEGGESYSWHPVEYRNRAGR